MRGQAENEFEGKILKIKIDSGYIINQVEVEGNFVEKSHKESLEDVLSSLHPSDSLQKIEKTIEKAVEENKIDIKVPNNVLAKTIKEAFFKLE